jgi:hypothetical protein
MNLEVDRRYFTGALWVHKLINFLWKFNQTIWDERNADRHGHTPLKNQAIRRNRLHTTVQTLYDASPRMLAADRDIFDLPAATRIRDHGPDRIELWIRRAKPIVAISIKEATKKIKTTFHSIANFFSRHHIRTLEDPTPDPEPPDRTHPQHDPPD